MYGVTIAFPDVLTRIGALRKNGHGAEALVTSVFTLEKLMRRSLRVAILARGFTFKHADSLLDKKGFENLKELWPVFDKDHRNLPALVPANDWQHVGESVKMRNNLVHGNRAYKVADCDVQAGYVVAVLNALHARVTADYAIDPWARLSSRRKPQLQWLTVKPAKKRKRDRGKMSPAMKSEASVHESIKV